MTGRRDRFRGCLLGGAVGDALGAGIEFMSLSEIRERFGPAGVTGYVPAYGRTGAITDDTQMTLFTAEALLRARSGADHERPGQIPAIWEAYQRWRLTQDAHPGLTARECRRTSTDGWLMTQDFLWSRRAPGTTCLRSLALGQPGSVDHRINDSKGCGGVMRVAPIGLVAAEPFTLGCEAAALTHGHPSGYRAAGALALMIAEIINGASVRDAATAAIRGLRRTGDGFEVAHALRAALRAAGSGPGTPETVAQLGEGWVAEEALAIAVYCALAADGFRSGVLLAVNHGGDSDSTGAICGNLLGTALGASAIDAALLAELEGGDVIGQVADDLYDVFATNARPPQERYPAGPPGGRPAAGSGRRDGRDG